MKCRCPECVEARAAKIENARTINRGEARTGWFYLIAVVALCAAAGWLGRATPDETAPAEKPYICTYNAYERGECLPVITRECFEKGFCK